MKNMKIVLAGRFSPPVLACIRSWGRCGHRVGFVCIDLDRGLKPYSKYLDDVAGIAACDVYTDAGILKIASFLDQFDADVLSCIDDNIACWLSNNASEFDGDISLALPSSGMIKKVLSKARQNEIAARAGLKVLPEYIITSDNIDAAVKPEHFPLCLRPSRPSLIHPAFKVHLVYSHEDLDHFVSSISFEKGGKIIAQPFKNLPNLVIHGIRSENGETGRLSAFIVDRKLEGVTLTLQPCSDLNRDLIFKCSEFVKLFDLKGNFHFEFLFDPVTGDAFFLEINLRFGGTTAKVLACGYDEPVYALEAYGAESVKLPGPEIKPVIVSNKQALLKYMAKALTGKLSILDYPDEPLYKKMAMAARGFFSFHDEVLCLDDLWGGLRLYLDNVIQIFKGAAG